jgi:hypothetical protein
MNSVHTDSASSSAAAWTHRRLLAFRRPLPPHNFCEKWYVCCPHRMLFLPFHIEWLWQLKIVGSNEEASTSADSDSTIARLPPPKGIKWAPTTCLSTPHRFPPSGVVLIGSFTSTTRSTNRPLPFITVGYSTTLLCANRQLICSHNDSSPYPCPHGDSTCRSRPHA